MRQHSLVRHTSPNRAPLRVTTWFPNVTERHQKCAFVWEGLSVGDVPGAGFKITKAAHGFQSVLYRGSEYGTKP